MARSNALAMAAGGLVVVALSFGAGMLGGSTGAPQGASGGAVEARAVPDSAVRGRLEELDRRVANLEEQVRIVQDSVHTALSFRDDLDALRRSVEALRGGAAGSAGAAAGGATNGDVIAPDAPLSAAERELREAERISKLKGEMLEFAKRNARGLLRQRLQNIADATEQGAANRRSQIYSESKRSAVVYSMTPQQESVLREILTEETESAVREVAPYLGGGFERADFAAIKGKLGTIWDRTDARMAEILGGQDLEDYREQRTGWRKAYDEVLDEWQAGRASK